jgi:ubiquinone/menaquinone biosynthesis C-methylase UbiE
MRKTNFSWDLISRCNVLEEHINEVLGAYKSKEFISLLGEWGIELNQDFKILKTDLREEAYGQDQILYAIDTPKNNLLHIFGIDISKVTVQHADFRQRDLGYSHVYITADVRVLPFKENSFDLILSSSTLDHFENKEDFLAAIKEMARVLRPNGNIVMTLNNRLNLNITLLFLLERALNLKKYPVQFYLKNEIKYACGQADLYVLEEEYIVHIVSPINSVLLIVEKIFGRRTADYCANFFVKIADWLSKIKLTRKYTAWFIAVKCSKKNVQNV